MSSRKQKDQFQELLEGKFHEWLRETGQRQELDSLIPSAVAAVSDFTVTATGTPTTDLTQPARHVWQAGR